MSKRIVIIGGGLGGLSAGIHLKIAGYDVAIYEANERVGGRANLIIKDGFRFDTGPSLLNYPWVFEDLFRIADRQLSDYVTLLPVDPSISFKWRDGAELMLSSNLQKLLDEFERLEPGARPRAWAYLRDAAEKYRFSFDKLVTRNEDSFIKWLSALSPGEMLRSAIWRSLDRELARFFKSRYIREALGSYGMYLGGSPYALPGLFSILAYGELAFGLWLPKGGIYGLISGVEKLARELGMEIYTGRKVTRIITKNSRVAGIEMRDGEKVSADLVISNVDLPTSDRELLARGEISSQSIKRLDKIRMTPGVTTFYWGIEGKLSGIAHHTIFLPQDCRAAYDELIRLQVMPRDLPFYMSVPSATDPDLAPQGCSAVFVLAPTPLISAMPAIDRQVFINDVKDRIIARLKMHARNFSETQICCEEVYTPADWRDRFGLYNGSAFGAAHTLWQMGPLRSKNYSREIAGLYYVGSSTTPGAGLPMVVLSGKMVAERIIEWREAEDGRRKQV
jgi:phytoene desaturase